MNNLIIQSTAELVKSNIPDMVDAIVAPVLDGEVGAVEVYAKIRFLEAVLAEAKTKLEESTIKALDNSNGKSGFGGVSLEFKNGGRMYSFAHDSEWERLDKAKKEREELMKKGVGTEGVVSGDEVVPPARVTYKKDSINVSIK